MDTHNEALHKGTYWIIPFLLSSAAAAKSLQSCLTLSNPMDCRAPGSSIHGIFQARVLEWGAIAFSSLIPKGQQTPWATDLIRKNGFYKLGSLSDIHSRVENPWGFGQFEQLKLKSVTL